MLGRSYGERLARVLLRWMTRRAFGFGALCARRWAHGGRLACPYVVLAVCGTCSVYVRTADGAYAGLNIALVRVSFLCEFIMSQYCLASRAGLGHQGLT